MSRFFDCSFLVTFSCSVRFVQWVLFPLICSDAYRDRTNFKIVNIKHVLIQSDPPSCSSGETPKPQTVQCDMGKIDSQLGDKLTETEAVIKSQIVMWKLTNVDVLTISMTSSAFFLIFLVFLCRNVQQLAKPIAPAHHPPCLITLKSGLW